MIRLTAVVGVIAASTACALTLKDRVAVAILPPPTQCADGQAVKVLTHVDCPDGLCGWSCLPDRWNRERFGTP